MTERANEKIKNILQKLLNEHLLGSEQSTSFHIPLEDLTEDTGVRERDLDSIFDHLGEKQIILDCWFPEDQTVNEYTIFCPTDFRQRANEYLSQFATKRTEGKTIIYLEADGTLWHGDKEKCACQLDSSRDRLNKLRYLIEDTTKDFIPTKTIAKDLGKKEQNIRSELGKINSKLNTSLHLDDVIENIKGKGYRVNPKYKIIDLG